eukprot:6477590-Amphidinium_carterae.2
MEFTTSDLDGDNPEGADGSSGQPDSQSTGALVRVLLWSLVHTSGLKDRSAAQCTCVVLRLWSATTLSEK